MFKKIALAGLVLVVLFVIVVALQPSQYRVSRSATIAASEAAVFAHVNDFRQWDAWSPWAKIDPQAKTSFEGPPTGEGAIFRWSGNNEIGEGSMTIVESRPNRSIRIRLHFVRPFEDTAEVEFAFDEANGKTTVTWSMHGKNNFVGKAMCLFMNMDQMIGSKYEEGLAAMKKLVESADTPKDAGQ